MMPTSTRSEPLPLMLYLRMLRRQYDFLGVVKRGELNYYLLLNDSDELALCQIQCNMARIKELADSFPAIIIIVRAIGFGIPSAGIQTRR
jgi:hypothetical protein